MRWSLNEDHVKQQSDCRCVLPSSTEEELITLPGSEPGTALRVYVETGPEGYVRLQQMAYSNGLGWYVQRSMVIPGEMLATLVPQLRKADCLIPRRPTGANWGEPIRLIPSPQPKPPLNPEPELRRA